MEKCRQTKEHFLSDSAITSREADVVYRPRTISVVVHRDSGEWTSKRGAVDSAKLQSALQFMPEVAGHDRHGEAVLNGFHKSRLLVWFDYEDVSNVNWLILVLQRRGYSMKTISRTKPSIAVHPVWRLGPCGC